MNLPTDILLNILSYCDMTFNILLVNKYIRGLMLERFQPSRNNKEFFYCIDNDKHESLKYLFKNYKLFSDDDLDEYIKMDKDKRSFGIYLYDTDKDFAISRLIELEMKLMDIIENDQLETFKVALKYFKFNTITYRDYFRSIVRYNQSIEMTNILFKYSDLKFDHKLYKIFKNTPIGAPLRLGEEPYNEKSIENKEFERYMEDKYNHFCNEESHKL